MRISRSVHDRLFSASTRFLVRLGSGTYRILNLRFSDDSTGYHTSELTEDALEFPELDEPGAHPNMLSIPKEDEVDMDHPWSCPGVRYGDECSTPIEDTLEIEPLAWDVVDCEAVGLSWDST